jgi:hypothetical protein
MSAPKHTPGPWNLGSSNVPVSLLSVHASIAGSKHSTIARLSLPKKVGIGYDEAEANARLIAAAPELLEALKACLHCFDEMTGRKPAFVEDSIAMGNEAVAKATGGEA